MYQDSEKCDFCGSVMLIHHNEGVTCSECSRVSSSEPQPQTIVTTCPLNIEKIKSDNPHNVWLSTAGDGIAWLHVRLDPSPKYYQHDEYRRS